MGFSTHPRWDDERAPAVGLRASTSFPPEWRVYRRSAATFTPKALGFTWSEDMTVADHGDLDITAALTISLWYYPTALGAQVLVEKVGAYAVRIANPGRISFVLTGVATLTVSNANRITSANRWYHIVCTYGGAAMDIWVDGVLKASAAAAGAIAVTATDLGVGCTPAGGAGGTTGRLDEVVLVSAGWTPTQVAADYNDGVGTYHDATLADLVAGWHLEDNTTDFGTGHNGVLSAAPPSYVAGLVSDASKGLSTWCFPPGVYSAVEIQVQLPHTYKQGSDIHPHLHWKPVDGVGGNVIFELEYEWTSINAAGSGPTTEQSTAAAGSTAFKHLYHALTADELDGAGQTISSMFCARLARRGDLGADTYDNYAAFLEFDLHILKDNDLGSYYELTKGP